MRGRSEGLVRDFGQESGSGPDADSGHAGQDRVKRVQMHQAFDFTGDLVALLQQGGELFGKARHDDSRGLGAGHDDGLFAKRLNDLGGQALAQTRSELGQAVGEGLLTGRGKCGG